MNETEEPLLTVKEVAAYLGKATSSVYRMRKLPRYRVGGSIRFRLSEIKLWLLAQKES